MTDSKKYTSKLSSSKILIIGGTSGIGFAVAEASLENGATVIISSSQQSRIDSAISRLIKSYPSAKDRISSYPCDLSSDDMESNIETLLNQAGTVDHIIITAGEKIPTLTLKDITLKTMQDAGRVRYFAPLLIAKHAISHLSPGPNSSITLTTGVTSQRPIKDWSVVSSYATALHGMARSLALDLAPVRVNLICAGFVETELWDWMSKEIKDAVFGGVKAKNTTGKLGQPEEIAEAYLYVMKNTSVTGSVINSDDGSLLT